MSPRQQIRDWWKVRLEEDGPIDLKEEAATALQEFMDDAEFCRAFVETFGKEVIYGVGQQMLQQDRHRVRSGSRYASRAQVVAAIDQELADAPPSWARFMEHDRESGLHISLLEMTKEQLIDAAKVRADRGIQELEDAAFLKLIAAKLQPNQIVNDVWSESALNQLRQRVQVKFSYKINEPAKSAERKAA